MISVLFLITGIHCTTNLKTDELGKNFFSPANTQSSSEESIKEKHHTFVGMYSSFTWLKCKYSIYVIDDIDTFLTLSDI